MDLSLINNELSESKLFRTTRNFQNLDGEAVAKLLYLTSLSIFLMAKDDKQEKYAREYAKKTTQYGPYAVFRAHATDLFLLAYTVNVPESRSVTLKQDVSSDVYLANLQFDNRQHWNFFLKIGRGDERNPEMASYFMRLEQQLKIKNGNYKMWRRLIINWDGLRYGQRQMVVTKLLQEIRLIGRTSEMVDQLSTMVRYRSYRLSDKYDNKPRTGRKIAGAVAGAAAGRYVGRKVATTLGKDEKTGGRVGTGLGAIAGYWAGGRK